MKSRHIILVLTVAFYAIFAMVAIGQSCGPVSDEAGVLRGTVNTSRLTDLGLDTHVVTVANMAKYGPRLQNVEDTYLQKCSNWTAPNGQAKSNLVVIMVAPSDRQKNLFFGDMAAKTFKGKDEITTFYTDTANSYFKTKDWVGGINATAGALADHITDFRHPKPAPPSEGWTILKWILGIVVFVVGLVFLLAFLNKRKKDRESIQGAQQKAIRARNAATDSFTAMDKTNPNYGLAASKYANLSGSLQNDPTTNGLTAEAYLNIADDWEKLDTFINRNPSQSPAAPPRREQRSYRKPEPPPTPSYTPVPPTPPPTPYYPPQQSTVIVDRGSSGSDFLTGMLVGEALEDRPRERVVEREVYREPAREIYREPVRETASGNDSGWGSSTKDDDDDNSGSDSSFSDDSSSSSSSGDDSGF